MVLGKLSVPGRPTKMVYSRARAYCACSRFSWRLFAHFLSCLSFLASFTLFVGDGQIKTEILSQWALKPIQPTNHPSNQPTNQPL